jgi:Rrf2 family protein
MIRINRQTDYAVRVLLCLARLPDGTRLSTSLIQQQMLIPSSFVPRIVAKLATMGLVTTYPGREGGITLSRPATEITLRDVVEAFEGPLCMSDCMDNEALECPFEGACPVRGHWGKLQMVMLRELERTSFAELALEGPPAPVRG